jgi:hypothetical protein
VFPLCQLIQIHTHIYTDVCLCTCSPNSHSIGSLTDRVFVREAMIRTATDILSATSTDLYTHPKFAPTTTAAAALRSGEAIGAAADASSPESKLHWIDMASAGRVPRFLETRCGGHS